MPELPEVEYARLKFLRHAEARIVDEARSLDSKVVEQTPRSFAAALEGARVLSAERKGKNILVELSDERALWFHLGMTGKVVAVRIEEPLPKFTRWWICTDDGERVCLTDPRRFGRAFAGPRQTVRTRSKIDALGIDALEIEESAPLSEALGRAKGPIKVVLMDQKRLAGLGNIQANEALWLAKIHPETPTPSLTPKELRELASSIRRTLHDTLERDRKVEHLEYVEEGGPNPFHVYGKEGERCARCRSAIERTVTAGRANFWCPKCQRLRASSSLRTARSR